VSARRTVDALGAHCPVPVRLVGRALGPLNPGAEVELLADDPLVAVDLPAWCHRRGHELVSIAADDRGVWRAVVRRGPM
jgi:TusA-related sulfurtransferase